MAINEIQVKSYREPLGGNNVNHVKWERYIVPVIHEQLQSANLRDLVVYNLQGASHSHEAGSVGRCLIIYANATFTGAGEPNVDSDGFVINGVETSHTKILGLKGIEGNVVIKSEEGLPLAEYNPRLEEMNILFNLFSVYDQKSKDLFKYIMKKFEELVWYPKTLQNSWKHTPDKEALLADLTERFKRQKEQQLSEDSYRHRELLDRIDEYKRQINTLAQTTQQLRRTIDTETNNINNLSSGLIKDIELVAEHKQVEDIHIIRGVFHVFTNDMYMYTQSGDRYYLGKMKFTINLSNTEVRFYNRNNPRQGYWTSEDPHPHVDGGNGNPCLGNVAATIAELCSRNEIYALVLTCLDFLENANTSDVAGERVRNWDRVDEEGNIISDDSEQDSWRCDSCERSYGDNDERIYVYENADGNRVSDESCVCSICLENDYRYSDFYDEYVHNDVEEPEGD